MTSIGYEWRRQQKFKLLSLPLWKRRIELRRVIRRARFAR